ncbi:hypothetical protein ASF71_19690 [Deinococcus sp. Leaf326]|nr:hypothetical protein ASF71_19690 [Deinococcus sp. Leaf326]
MHGDLRHLDGGTVFVTLGGGAPLLKSLHKHRELGGELVAHSAPAAEAPTAGIDERVMPPMGLSGVDWTGLGSTVTDSHDIVEVLRIRDVIEGLAVMRLQTQAEFLHDGVGLVLDAGRFRACGVDIKIQSGLPRRLASEGFGHLGAGGVMRTENKHPGHIVTLTHRFRLMYQGRMLGEEISEKLSPQEEKWGGLKGVIRVFSTLFGDNEASFLENAQMVRHLGLRKAKQVLEITDAAFALSHVPD